MSANLRYPSLLPAVVGVALMGCTSGPRSQTAERNVSASANGHGLSQLDIAPAVRRVWTGPGIDLEVRPSPDGRFFSKTDWSTGGVTLHEWANGTDRIVIQRPRAPEIIGNGGKIDFAENTIVSPDGSSVAYGWWVARTATWELRIAALSGPDSGRVRTVYSLPEGAFVGADAWTPDGASVITIVSPSRAKRQIVSVPAAGGRARVLHTVSGGYPSNMKVSPDGRWIAYDHATDGRDKDAYVIGIGGQNNTVIAQSKGDDAVLGWVGTEGRLLIMSDRSGTPSVWAFTIVDGKPAGEPILVRANLWRSAPAGTAADGRSFYSVSVGERDVYSASLDTSTFLMTSKGPSITGGNQGSNPRAFAWSPDGEYAAYLVWRGGSMNYYGKEDVIIRSLNRGELRRLSPKMVAILRMTWFPDGSAILLRGKDEQGRIGLFRLDMKDASVTPLVIAPLGPNFPQHAEFTADGRIAFLTRDSTNILLNVFDPGHGTTAVVRRIGTSRDEPRALAINPDGISFAIAMVDLKSKESRLVVGALNGSADRVAYRLPTSEVFAWDALSWARGGQSIVVGVSLASRSAVVHVDDIRRLSLQDLAVTSVGAKSADMMAFAVSPDGRSLMYGIRREAREMWMMDAPVFRPAPRVAAARR